MMQPSDMCSLNPRWLIIQSGLHEVNAMTVDLVSKSKTWINDQVQSAVKATMGVIDLLRIVCAFELLNTLQILGRNHL